VLRFFAGIHMRVLDGSSSTLGAHFPSAGGDGDARAAMGAIAELLDASPEAVQGALAVTPQTNEVGRSPALASGLLVVASQTGMPIRLREIGSSGGLNLRLDSYWYERDGEGWGTNIHLCGSPTSGREELPVSRRERRSLTGAGGTGIRSMRPARWVP
jgi:hypothetical protein